jgi:ABC-type dipeptide/oligopeptide/nickel transport system permease component
MVLAGTILAIVTGTVAGSIAAWKRGTAIDRASVTAALVFYSLPTQWLALVFIILFGSVLPTHGMSDPFALNTKPFDAAVDTLKHMILPSTTLALVLLGQYTLVVRSSMVGTLSEDYILTARAKGLSDVRILRRYAFRNSMLPVTTLIALSLGYVVAGSILIETVFSWPGIGSAMYSAVLARDYPTLQAGFMILTISVVSANFVADLLYAKHDPRVTA